MLCGLGMINLAYFEAWLSLVERCVRDAEVVGSNPVASTTWQGQPETLILSAFPVLFLRVSNEPCVDRMAGGCRELAHRQTHGRLDTYGECRDSHELRSSEVTCRHGALHHKAVCRHVSSALSPRAYWPSPLRTLILRFCRCFLSLWFHQMLF